MTSAAQKLEHKRRCRGSISTPTADMWYVSLLLASRFRFPPELVVWPRHA